MVGRLFLCLLLVLVFAAAQRKKCDVFRRDYCNLTRDNVLMGDAKISSPVECQMACIAKKGCIEFAYFAGEFSNCIFFKSCSNPKSSCENCIGGPAFPRLDYCLSKAQKDRKRRKKSGGRSRIGSERLNRPSTRYVARQRNEQLNDEPDMDYEYDDDDEVNIDDGLLDALFDDLTTDEPTTTTDKQTTTTTKTATTAAEPPTKEESSGENSNQGECPACDGYYYCVLGGRNAKGPISTVSVLNIGTYSVPSTTLISSFSSFMTQGNGITFSLFSGNSLRTCSPGYQISTFQQNNIQSVYVPGSCSGYGFSADNWVSTGGEMTAFRDGGSTVNVGSYIMSVGGFDKFGQKLTSIELFDPRRPDIGWRDVPQWRFHRATRDQCTVVTNDPKLGDQVLVMGGLGEEHSVMKLVLSTNNWYSVSPMIHPRAQHGCTSITLNGRPGVVVSGGVDRTSSVEFFDMKTQKWIDLPDLKRGRRGHTMSTINGKLVVAGGVTTGRRGKERFLDDVEEFDGKRWRRAKYKLDQPRSGANLVKIPIKTLHG